MLIGILRAHLRTPCPKQGDILPTRTESAINSVLMPLASLERTSGFPSPIGESSALYQVRRSIHFHARRLSLRTSPVFLARWRKSRTLCQNLRSTRSDAFGIFRAHLRYSMSGGGIKRSLSDLRSTLWQAYRRPLSASLVFQNRRGNHGALSRYLRSTHSRCVPAS